MNILNLGNNLSISYLNANQSVQWRFNGLIVKGDSLDMNKYQVGTYKIVALVIDNDTGSAVELNTVVNVESDSKLSEVISYDMQSFDNHTVSNGQGYIGVRLDKPVEIDTPADEFTMAFLSPDFNNELKISAGWNLIMFETDDDKLVVTVNDHEYAELNIDKGLMSCIILHFKGTTLTLTNDDDSYSFNLGDRGESDTVILSGHGHEVYGIALCPGEATTITREVFKK